MRIKKLAFIGFALVILTVILVYNAFFIESYPEPKTSDFNIKINALISEKAFIKGFIQVDQKHFISENFPLLQKHKTDIKRIGDVKPPFHIFKKVQNDTLIVVKDRDSMLFTVFDESNSHLRDPTFRDIYEYYIK